MLFAPIDKVVQKIVMLINRYSRSLAEFITRLFARRFTFVQDVLALAGYDFAQLVRVAVER